MRLFLFRVLPVYTGIIRTECHPDSAWVGVRVVRKRDLIRPA